MRRYVLALLLPLAACSGRPAEPAPPSDSLLDLWAAVPVGMGSLAGADVPAVCDASFGTWFEDFGVRGLACAVQQKVRLGEAAGRFAGRIWVSGPHGVNANGLDLDLKAGRTFGRYNPEFVAWAIANAVPQTEGAVRLVQPVYDAHVRRLARVYWLSYRDLAARGFPEALPDGPLADYASYLEGGPTPDAPGYDGGVSMHALFRPLSDEIVAQLVPRGEDEWRVRYEANTAYGFWLRRRADGTESLFRDGLRDVIETLDPVWIADLEP